MLIHNKNYEELINSQKSIVFVTDRSSYYNVVRDDILNSRIVYESFYDDTSAAIARGHDHIVTSCISLISFDLLDKGYRIFVVREKKILELKLGAIDGSLKDFRRGHNLLKLFMGGAFDGYWGN